MRSRGELLSHDQSRLH